MPGSKVGVPPVSLRLAICLLLVTAVAAGAESPHLETIREASLDLGAAVRLESVMLEVPEARFFIEEGVLVPAEPIGGERYEFVFLGSGQFQFEPLEEVERDQLDLFTDEEHVDAQIDQAVLVLASRTAAGHLTSQGEPAELEEDERTQANEIFEDWRDAGGRHSLAVEAALLRLAWEDPTYAAYFAGWFHNEELEDFYYLVEPDSDEQITLGRFEPIEATDKERRKIERQLGKAQKKGRLIGLEVDHLGQWDTWVSLALGEGAAEAPAVERHLIDFTVESGLEMISARWTGTVRGGSYAAQVLRLTLDNDLQADSVAVDGEGTDFHRHGVEILVRLPRPLEPGASAEVEIGYSGRGFEDWGNIVVLRNSTHWYPQPGELGKATYDVTLRWPKNLDLVASGRREQGGVEGNQRWERRVLESPAWAFGFEIGRYEIERTVVGDVQLALAVDSATKRSAGGNRDDLLPAAAEAIAYFEELFGPAPHKEITLVTTPRGYSQSLPGLITLSSAALSDDWISDLFRDIDPRVLVAHEVAHQWWGHVVFWKSYRDQWISEAMANYAASLYAKHRLRASELRPTGAWKSSVGRYDDLGPVVLGQRLASSKSRRAYSEIVYKKGAVVFDMLARRYGEDVFPRILRAILDAVRFEPISTEQFLDLVERVTDTDTSTFAEQFVYGTGIPEVVYDYAFEQGADGGWKIIGSIRQRPAYVYDYALEPTGSGGFRVERSGRVSSEHRTYDLVVPVQIAVFDPSFEEERLKGRKRRRETPAEDRGNRVMQYHIALQGDELPLNADVPLEPKQFWLDAGDWVLGNFYNARYEPKKVLQLEARTASAEGDDERAIALYREALEAEFHHGPTLKRSSSGEGEASEESEEHRLDSAIQFELARLLLDRGELAAAEAAWNRGERELNDSNRDRLVSRSLSSTARAQRGRLHLLEGNAEKAFRELYDDIYDDGVSSTEMRCLLAVAALESGHMEELEDELEELEDLDVDVAELRAAAGLES